MKEGRNSPQGWMELHIIGKLNTKVKQRKAFQTNAFSKLTACIQTWVSLETRIKPSVKLGTTHKEDSPPACTPAPSYTRKTIPNTPAIHKWALFRQSLDSQHIQRQNSISPLTQSTLQTLLFLPWCQGAGENKGGHSHEHSWITTK